MAAPYRFGPFFLDARIAVGGTAEVYLARPATATPDLPERLVVKRLLPHFASDAEGRTMFEREARLHAAVTHENVVTVYHAGKDERGEPYLAMEYIDGVDGYRLLRRLRQQGEYLPIGVAVYVAREVLRALESVHAARDPTSGGLLGIVHRDVTPSNIYLSKDGTVKLGDFGIARSTTRATLRSEAGHVLKGKFAYLSPEQVAGEPSDHRADLFSLATVLAEMLLNRPLFPGGGQLAILLAIRDCRIDALIEMKPRLPPGLFEVMQRALARKPADRFESAAELAAALAPFEADKRLAAREIAARVRWVRASGSSDQIVAQRHAVAVRAVKVASASRPPALTGVSASTSAPAPRPSVSPSAERVAPPDPEVTFEEVEDEFDDDDDEGAKTSEYALFPSYVLKADGTRLGPWTFARLMEALATGQVDPIDQVDFVGRGLRRAEDIDEFARFFPGQGATTSQVDGPGTPDLHDQIGPETILRILLHVFSHNETGVLFAERAEDDATGAPASRIGRKELYFVRGKLHHVASSDASELLGEYLVRRGKLERAELDLALAVLPRYGGRMGDTLISLGLVDPVDIFRAIREQGRDRVADLFLWRGGSLSFYRGHTAPHVEFPLDLDVPSLMLAGLETAKPGDTILAEHRPNLDRLIAPAPEHFEELERATWPPIVTTILELVRKPVPLRWALQQAIRSGGVSTGEALRAVEILLAARLLAWE